MIDYNELIAEKIANAINLDKNEIKQYTSQIEILNTEIKKLDEENHALKDELNSMQVYAAGIQKSISWRITAPLRKISAILRKIIKKIIKK